VSVVNVGDEHGRRLAEEIEGVVTFAVQAPAARADADSRAPADYSASELRCDLEGCRFTLHSPAGEREVALPMPGHFNVANALGAIAAVHALGGADLELLLAALERGVRVPGRFEPVEQGQEFAVLVDYAHTPDSLENVLCAARELANAREGGPGRVICVFGAGGDRDRGKRPLMGEIAARLADVVLVTSDNPRSEDPQEIIDEIMAGVRRGEAERSTTGKAPLVRAIVDRAGAIAEAVASAAPGDVVIIAGKGHEQGQEFADGRKLPFDDATVALEALRAREAPSGADRPAGARA
jgi:UDP-N-acetylmuramoyl-L-alanyl-D-glutamate--2,6-diaminopimelate ligase